MLGLGAVAALAASCRSSSHGGATPTTVGSPQGAGVAPPATTTTTPTPVVVVRGSIPPPRPGPPTVISNAPDATPQIALTIYDGFCAPGAAAYVDFAARTGIHITFSPNGTYREIWDPLAPALQPLIDTGQVQIGNHTYTHADLRHLSDAKIHTELERNEEWIQSTFKITARPWMRPPYGSRNKHTDAVVSALGYTNVVMWNGSFGDSVLLSPDKLLAEARKHLLSGTIMLGHANHPTVIGLFPQIQAIIKERNLQPVTLDEMFGTSRDHG